MNIVLWVITCLLALVFSVAGLTKISRAKPKLVESGQPWAEGFSERAIKTIGALEISVPSASSYPRSSTWPQ